MSDLPWYKEGLSFKCTGCGQCCTGFPGYVWVSDKEIKGMSRLLGLSTEEFTKKYLRKIGGRLSLKEHPKTFDCVFLKDNKCQVYQERPLQCQTFPWWDENLKSRQAWEEAAKRCEGISHPEAPLISLSQIEEERNRC